MAGRVKRTGAFGLPFYLRPRGSGLVREFFRAGDTRLARRPRKAREQVRSHSIWHDACSLSGKARKGGKNLPEKLQWTRCFMWP